MFTMMQLPPGESMVLTFMATVLAFTALWLINVRIRDAGIVDYYWGPGFAVIGILHLFLAQPGLPAQSAGEGSTTIYRLAFLAAVIIWSFRLLLQLAVRHLSSREEDARYHTMRMNGGTRFWWTSLFKIFLAQAVLQWLIAAPVHGAMLYAGDVNAYLFMTGFAIFAAGFVLESVADWQLFAGKMLTPAGKTYTSGLWGYSRHPNYLGEMTLWWGLALSAWAMGAPAWVFLGPALLMLVILKVSLPLTEKHLMLSRRDYSRYARTVPALLPGFGSVEREREPEAAE